jgi:1,4-dihydroxy-2-naphthoyl-CoA synthase
MVPETAANRQEGYRERLRAAADERRPRRVPGPVRAILAGMNLPGGLSVKQACRVEFAAQSDLLGDPVVDRRATRTTTIIAW